MTVYLDLVLGLNFTVDFLLLLGTNRLCGFPVGMLRASAAASLGAVYAAGAMFPRFSFLGSSFWRLVFLGLMGVIAFGLNRSAWKRTGIFVLLSMAMGGIAMGLRKTDIPALLLSAASVWLLSHIGFGGSVGGKNYIPIIVKHGERFVSVIALMDTGNSLKDPITGEQVLILGPREAEKLLHLSSEELSHPMETLVSHPGLRLIPYNSVGQPGGMLLAKRFADVTVGQRRCSAVIAFTPEPIGTGQVYQALAGGSI